MILDYVRREMSDQDQMIKNIGMVIHPVENLDAAATFYSEGLGLQEAFRDGDRFCAFVVNGITIALAAKEERIIDSAAVSYKVNDVGETVNRLENLGAKLCRGTEEGPHEIRAVMEDPQGNPFIIYSSKEP